MTNTSSVRAKSGAALALDKHAPRAAHDQTDLTALAPYMLLMMMRNITSDGFVVEDPATPGQYSLPGCVIAAPSFPRYVSHPLAVLSGVCIRLPQTVQLTAPQ